MQHTYAGFFLFYLAVIWPVDHLSKDDGRFWSLKLFHLNLKRHPPRFVLKDKCTKIETLVRLGFFFLHPGVLSLGYIFGICSRPNQNKPLTFDFLGRRGNSLTHVRLSNLRSPALESRWGHAASFRSCTLVHFLRKYNYT